MCQKIDPGRILQDWGSCVRWSRSEGNECLYSSTYITEISRRYLRSLRSADLVEHQKRASSSPDIFREARLKPYRPISSKPSIRLLSCVREIPKHPNGIWALLWFFFSWSPTAHQISLLLGLETGKSPKSQAWASWRCLEIYACNWPQRPKSWSAYAALHYNWRACSGAFRTSCTYINIQSTHCLITPHLRMNRIGHLQQ